MQFVSQGAASLSCCVCGGLKGPQQRNIRKLYHRDVIFIRNRTDIIKSYIIYPHHQKWYYLSDFWKSVFPLYSTLNCLSSILLFTVVICLDSAKHLLFKYQFFPGSRFRKKALKINCFFLRWMAAIFSLDSQQVCWFHVLMKKDIKKKKKCHLQQHTHLFHVGNISGFLQQCGASELREWSSVTRPCVTGCNCGS